MEFITANFAPIMFAGLICFLLLGFPVAFSLGACGLTFGIIGIELGVFPSSVLAWLPQRPIFVAGSVADNLRLAAPAASDAELRDVLARVALDRRITDLDAEVGEDGSDVLGVDDDVDLVDRLEQRHHLGRRHLAQGQAGRGLEGLVAAVDAVRLAVGEGDDDIDDRPAGEQPGGELGAGALLDARDVPLRHGATDDPLGEDD